VVDIDESEGPEFPYLSESSFKTKCPYRLGFDINNSALIKDPT
jgi:hypothetical protein